MLGKHTRFDRGNESFRSYLISNLERKRVSFPRFVDYFKKTWDLYTKGDVGINISRFFMEKGHEFMKRWYTDVFSFPKRISFEFEQGGTQVDVLITIIYLLSQIEINCLNEIIEKYKIKNKTVNIAALISLLEPCVLLTYVLSRIVGQEFRLSIEDRTIENNKITLELSARPK